MTSLMTSPFWINVPFLSDTRQFKVWPTGQTARIGANHAVSGVPVRDSGDEPLLSRVRGAGGRLRIPHVHGGAPPTAATLAGC